MYVKMHEFFFILLNENVCLNVWNFIFDFLGW